MRRFLISLELNNNIKKEQKMINDLNTKIKERYETNSAEMVRAWEEFLEDISN